MLFRSFSNSSPWSMQLQSSLNTLYQAFYSTSSASVVDMGTDCIGRCRSLAAGGTGAPVSHISQPQARSAPPITTPALMVLQFCELQYYQKLCQKYFC